MQVADMTCFENKDAQGSGEINKEIEEIYRNRQ